jgi:hypothetical protein
MFAKYAKNDLCRRVEEARYSKGETVDAIDITTARSK